MYSQLFLTDPRNIGEYLTTGKFIGLYYSILVNFKFYLDGLFFIIICIPASIVEYVWKLKINNSPERNEYFFKDTHVALLKLVYSSFYELLCQDCPKQFNNVPRPLEK